MIHLAFYLVDAIDDFGRKYSVIPWEGMVRARPVVSVG
jgi:hypothetical protein